MCVALPFGTLDVVLPWYVLAVGGTTTQIGLIGGAAAATTLVVRPLAGSWLGRGAVKLVLVLGLSAVCLGLGIWSIANHWSIILLGRIWTAGGMSSIVLAAQVIIAGSPEHGGRNFGFLTSALFVSAAIGSILAGILLVLFDRETQTTVLELSQQAGINLRLPTPVATRIALQRLFVVYTVAALVGYGYIRHIQVGPQTQPIRLRQAWRELVAQAQIRHLIAVQLLLRCGYSMTIPLLIVLLNDRFGLNLINFAIAYAIPGVLYVLLPARLGRVADRIGYPKAIQIGLFTSACVYGLLPWLPHIQAVSGIWIAEACAYGLYAPAFLALIARRVTISHHGAIFSLNNVVADVGALIAAPTGGLLYAFVAPWAPFSLAALAFCGAALIIKHTPP